MALLKLAAPLHCVCYIVQRFMIEMVPLEIMVIASNCHYLNMWTDWFTQLLLLLPSADELWHLITSLQNAHSRTGYLLDFEFVLMKNL